MREKFLITAKQLFLIFILLHVGLSACGPGQLLGPTMTPTPTNTPTSTPTQTPTSTPTHTPTLTPTNTSTPTFTPTRTPLPTNTPTPFPVQVGWREYDLSGFHIAVPEQWIAVDIDKEGFDAILGQLGDIESDWAKNTTEMMSSEAMQEMTKFWAMDSEPAGVGYASTNVTYQTYFIEVEIEDFYAQMLSAYQQMGITVTDSKCDLVINNLDAAWFEFQLGIGPFSVKEHQYVYLNNRDIWSVIVAVDVSEWNKYESIFGKIAESFRVD
ncbi:MAG: hypothetical protein ACK2U3_10860 [Anaerolineales bacterium]|jgi:hypothetical protein